MVSVIIPTYNAASYLPSLLKSLEEQTLPHELIILDSESSDETKAILAHNNISVHTIPKGTFNHGATRNIGTSLAKHNVLVFLTQDALPANKYTLENIVKMLLSRDDMPMVYGRQLPYPDASTLSQFARLSNYPPESLLKTKALIPKLGIKTCNCSNSFAAYRKDKLIEHGGFPSDAILGEEVTLAAKLILEGQILGYCGDAEVYHSHNYTIGEEFKRYFDIGVFHYEKRSLISHYTRAESEGFAYIIDEVNYLIRNAKAYLIPEQFIRTVAKYVAYKAGQWHTKLPISLKRRWSMHSFYWK
ncbi:glycosyltransferase family 2 protein [Spirosoma sp. BT702]|uniref:Glycosyltransferase family 2 protein n=1 Tax=Spirosoma profusum TaxID=2771354 RepID=A0A927AVF0_9BACT|nr:glycosyltransferase family 2 protein [Spirosoma profusum]MBD2705116.1 glycosyltransferase family 2 protein [Spirosoma profusum]